MKKKLSSVDKILKNTNEETTLYEWTAAERAFKKRDKDFWITAVAILVLFSVVLVFIQEFFFKKMVFCICEAVKEDMVDENNPKEITELDIGIGKLYVKVVGTEVKYKFEPSEYLQKAMLATATNKENPLPDFLDESLGKKFIDLYKEIC